MCNIVMAFEKMRRMKKRRSGQSVTFSGVLLLAHLSFPIDTALKGRRNQISFYYQSDCHFSLNCIIRHKKEE